VSGKPPSYGGVTVVCTRHRQQVRLDDQEHLRHVAGRKSVAGDRCDSAEFAVRREELAQPDAAAAFLKALKTIREM
jgi:hypothetical protein